MVYRIVDLVTNIFRSIPFVILLIFLIPLTRWLVGTAIGVRGAIVPLVFGAVPFFTRQVEVALAGVSPGKVEAATAMGSSPTAEQTEVRPPTQSHMGKRAIQPSDSAVWSSLLPRPLTQTACLGKLRPFS